MNIVFASPECFPFAKAGSLADLVCKLSKDIEKTGNNVKIFIPRYGLIDPSIFHIERLPLDFKVKYPNDGKESFVLTSVYKGILPNSLVSVFLIESQNHFSNSKEIYLSSSADKERFGFFSRAVLEIINRLKINLDIFHLFNNETARILTLLKNKNIEYANLKSKGILYTIYETNNDSLNIDLEAISNADFVTTPSGTYAYELLSGIYGSGMTNSLIQKKDLFCGILTSPDEDTYNPETDSLISQVYTKNYFTPGKKKCKEDLLELAGFDGGTQSPLFGLISRFSDNESRELLKSAIQSISSLNLQVLILVTGNESYFEELYKLTEQYKNIRVIFSKHYEDSITRKIYSGSDFLLSLKQSEPSGLSVLIGMIYGSIPVAYSIGAIKEIVIDVEFGEKANGFVFKELKKESFLETLEKAIRYYKNKEIWPGLVKQAMSFNSSEFGAAKKYLNCYERVIKVPVKS